MNGPAMEPPPGRQSNFVNPANLNTEGLVLIVSCLIASMLVVSMRMWTKIRLVRRVVLEDCSSTPYRWNPCISLLTYSGVCCLAQVRICPHFLSGYFRSFLKCFRKKEGNLNSASNLLRTDHLYRILCGDFALFASWHRGSSMEYSTKTHQGQYTGMKPILYY